MNQVKISDVLGNEYSDFLAYCSNCGKTYTFELNNVDFVAFRTISGKPKEYIKEIKSKLTDRLAVSGSIELSNNADSNSAYNDAQTDTIIENISADDRISSQTGNDFAPLPHPESSNNSINSKKAKSKSIADSLPVSEKEIKTKLGHLFGIDSSKFVYTSIDKLKLGTRASNCLKRAKYMTVGDVLSVSMEELIGLKNMGRTSASEIYKSIKIFAQSLENGGHADNYMTPSVLNNRAIKKLRSPALRNIIESALYDEVFPDDLSINANLAVYSKIKADIDLVGKEMCIETYRNPEYGAAIFGMLWEFSENNTQYYRIKQKVSELLRKLPPYINDRKAVPFVQVYLAKTGQEKSYLLQSCDADTIIAEIPNVLENHRGSDELTQLADEIIRFLRWTNIDIEAIRLSISEKNNTRFSGKNARCLEILKLREQGETLESLGTRYGLTRERIRQLENKGQRIAWSVLSVRNCNIVVLIYALEDGKTIIRFDDFCGYLGEQTASLLWLCIKNNKNNKSYYYSRILDAAVVNIDGKAQSNESASLSEISSFLATLPNVFEVAQKETLLNGFEERLKSNRIPLELFDTVFKSVYHRMNSFFYKGRLTLTFMVGYVLKNRFQAGFKISDPYETNRLNKYMLELFGKNVETISQHAIDAKISVIGVLCDRGKYIHPDLLQVDPSVIDAVNEYIEASSRAVLPYGEIFEDLKNTFNGTQITNKYFLQGALKKYGCRFYSGRDYIKKSDSASFADVLEAFIEERGIVHKSEIFAEFASMNDARLGTLVSRCANVFNIENGYYIHVSQFDIQPEDYSNLRGYLTEACKEIPVNIRSVYDAVSVRFPDFIYRNDFDDISKLFAALNYMFRDEFRFSRPYIAALGADDISNRSVILKHIEEFDSIGIEELIDICEDHSIHYVSTACLIQSLVPDYFRINSTTLMKRELAGITDDVVAESAKIVLEMLTANDYIVGSRINDYLWFPQIDVEWNEFLLESVILQSGKVNIVYLIGDVFKHTNAVYVSDRYRGETFNSLLVKILNDEVHQSGFNSKAEMRDWLREKGLIEVNLPGFLQSTKYFYVDETGVHCTGE